MCLASLSTRSPNLLGMQKLLFTSSSPPEVSLHMSTGNPSRALSFSPSSFHYCISGFRSLSCTFFLSPSPLHLWFLVPFPLLLSFLSQSFTIVTLSPSALPALAFFPIFVCNILSYPSLSLSLLLSPWAPSLYRAWLPRVYRGRDRLPLIVLFEFW
jgi:hypothetical protein